MNATFFQWARFGFGGFAWFKKHKAAVDDAIALYQSIFPPEAPSTDGITYTEAIEKIRTGDMTEAERADLDRESGNRGGAG